MVIEVARTASQYSSNKGRYVACSTGVTNLIRDDANGVPVVFMRDQQTGVTEWVSVVSNGNHGDEASREAALGYLPETSVNIR